MKQGIKIKVLWIDDQPLVAFQKEAEQKGIELIIQTNVNDGLKCLNDSKNVFDAIILDANCVITNQPEETPDINALTYAIVKLYSMQVHLPWFVLTGESYEGREALEYIIPDNRPWDDREFYEKNSDRLDLLNNILKAVGKNDVTQTKMQYAEVCHLYQEKDLVDLLLAYHTDPSFDSDATVPNVIRTIVEWILKFCNERGILPTPFTGTNIAECSRVLGNKRLSRYIPSYIQRSLHLLAEYSNAGSHRYESRFQKIIGEGIREDIENGTAKYLNRMATMALLNVLHWCNRLSDDPETVKRLQIQIDYELSS